MPSQLTPAQQAFIAKHIKGKPKAEQQKVTKAFLDFDRRKTKIETELARLEPSHPQRPILQKQVAGAQAKAKKGQFEAAYDDLESVKAAARAAAKGYLAGLSGSQLLRDASTLFGAVDKARTERQAVRGEMNRLIAEAQAYTPRPDAAANFEQAVQYRRALTEQEAKWSGTVQTLRARIGAVATAVANLSLKTTMVTLDHRAQMLIETGSKAEAKLGQATKAVLAKVYPLATSAGTLLTADIVTQNFKEQVWIFQDAVDQAKDMSRFQQRDPEPALAKFKQFDMEEKRRLGKAKGRYLKAVHQDQLGAMRDKAAQLSDEDEEDDQDDDQDNWFEDLGPVELRRFHADDVLDDDEFDVDDAAIDDAKVGACKTKAAAALAKLIASEKPGSDALFDLMLKAKDDLKADVAAAMGFSRTGDDWSPVRAKLIEGIADGLYQTMLAKSPNVMAADGSTITVNGVTYAQPEVIGQGGLGKITRYKDPKGASVVVKSLLSAAPGKREEMVKEMRIHRQIMGGEDGEPHPNVVAMKGAAVSADGSLHMLMDEAGGGDLNNFAAALAELKKTGLVPPAARTALTQTVLRDATLGLKAVHDQGALHLDLKAQNYLMDTDGTVKIADFGSSQIVPEGESVDAGSFPTTPAFAPADQDVTQQSEVAWLGAMVESLSSDLGPEGSIQKANWKSFATLRTGTNAGALDRLRNAMLDPAPDQRPSLESILMSSYLSDASQSYTDGDVRALLAAVTKYNKAVGGNVYKISREINIRRAKLENGKPAANAPRKDRDAYAVEEKRVMAEIATYQGQLDAINADPKVKPLLEAVKAASLPFQ